MVELLVGTTNSGKLHEVQNYLKRLPLKILGLHSLGKWPTVIEDGTTYEENALKKAKVFADYSGDLTLADDSGLEVDALNGEPGINSARYGGEESNDQKNNQKLLAALADVPAEKRTARFVCVLALYAPNSSRMKQRMKQWTVRKFCEGRIVLAPRGARGFGYDPIFFYPPLGMTFGEIDRETKARVSHRGKALEKLARIFPSIIDLGTKP